jgi:hypothetical protein
VRNKCRENFHAAKELGRRSRSAARIRKMAVGLATVTFFVRFSNHGKGVDARTTNSPGLRLVSSDGSLPTLRLPAVRVRSG